MPGSHRNNGAGPALPFPRPRRASSIRPMVTINETGTDALGDLSAATEQLHLGKANTKIPAVEVEDLTVVPVEAAEKDDDQGNKPLAPMPGLTRTRVREENGGRHVCTKYRKFVVVATYGIWFTALPIFTFNGEGLAKKHKGTDEFVSIRDMNRPPHADPESRHPSIFCTANPALRRSNNPWNFMTDSTVVALTYPVTFRYQVRCTLMGSVQPQGTSDLITLFHNIFLADVQTFLTNHRTLLNASGNSILGKAGPVVDEDGYQLPKTRRSSIKGGGGKYKLRSSMAGSMGSGYSAASVRKGGVRTISIGSKATDTSACFKCGHTGHVFKHCLAKAR